MSDYVRLKTPTEQKRDIERDLDFLDHQEQAALSEYQCRLADIERQRKRLLKQYRKIMRKEVSTR